MAARDLLVQAGGFQAGKLDQRLALAGQAEAHTLAAQRRLGRWPLRQVVTVLQPIQTRAPTRASIQRAADTLLALHGSLERDLEQVRATGALAATAANDRYLEAATSVSGTAGRAGQALQLAAGLYGPPARPLGFWLSRTPPSGAPAA